MLPVRSKHVRRAIVAVWFLSGTLGQTVGASWQLPDAGSAASERQTLDAAHELFYNAQYEAASAAALALRSAETGDLENYELRSSAILFQLKALLEGNGDVDPDKLDKKAALRNCAPCPDLIATFMEDIREGQTRARAILKADPKNARALFFLGKIDLNYVWLQLGPLGKRTGWDEYWEARRSLDAVLKLQPDHVRAKVARAWIDYIVDTKMPWGTGWLLGGGNKKRALANIRAAVAVDTDRFTHVEAEFALWNMLIRERQMTEATAVAERLARVFPDNVEVGRFLTRQKTVKP